MPARKHGSIVRSKPGGSFVLVHPDGREEPYEVGTTDRAKRDATTDEDIARQIADDPEVAPEWTEEMFARAVLMDGDRILPRRGPGRPKSEAPKKAVSLRLDPDVVEKFRAGGAGWQSRINATLRAAVIDMPPASEGGGRSYVSQPTAKRAAVELGRAKASPAPKKSAKADTAKSHGKTGKREA